MRLTVELRPALRAVLGLLAFVLVALPSSAKPQKAPQDNAQQPLILESQGSFFVGGHLKHTTVRGVPNGFAGSLLEDDIMVDQMYVQYQIPQAHGSHVPIVLVHGCCLSGKTWETTPDGRMGWAEYFVRQGRPVYVPDQTSRGRSGFDATAINQAKLGSTPSNTIPNIVTFGRDAAWKIFRFGPEYPTAFPDEQFPVAAFDELAKQVIPDLNTTLPNPNPTFANLASLAVLVKGAIIVGHSESGFWPQRAALADPAGVRGMISIEGSCPTNLNPQELAALAKNPILVLYGDHLSDVPTVGVWAPGLAGCKQFVQQVTDAGGDATVLHLPEAGIRGNSHMLMQDLNNLKVADLLLAWIEKHVERSR